mgnify:CR=1 FL=1
MHGLIWLRGDEHSLGRNEEWLSALDGIPNTLIRPRDEQHVALCARRDWIASGKYLWIVWAKQTRWLKSFSCYQHSFPQFSPRCQWLIVYYYCSLLKSKLVMLTKWTKHSILIVIQALERWSKTRICMWSWLNDTVTEVVIIGSKTLIQAARVISAVSKGEKVL